MESLCNAPFFGEELSKPMGSQSHLYYYKSGEQQHFDEDAWIKQSSIRTHLITVVGCTRILAGFPSTTCILLLPAMPIVAAELNNMSQLATPLVTLVLLNMGTHSKSINNSTPMIQICKILSTYSQCHSIASIIVNCFLTASRTNDRKL